MGAARTRWTDERLDDFTERFDRFEERVDTRIDERLDRFDARLDSGRSAVLIAMATILASAIGALVAQMFVR